MAWVWNPWALVNLAAGFVSASLAVAVWTAAGGRLQNRALAAMMFTYALSFATRGLAHAMDRPEDAFGWWSAHLGIWVWTALGVVFFLGTLPSPLVRPLASPVVRWSIGLVAVASLVAWVLSLRARTIAGVHPTAFYAPWSPAPARGSDLFVHLSALSLVVALLSLVVALDLVRRSPAGSQTRRQAKAYAIAFGVTDVVAVALFLAIVYLRDGGTWVRWVAVVNQPEAANAFAVVLRVAMAAGWALNGALLAALLGYAILRTQLFDIDLKIKWGLSKGTLGAAFVGVFFVVSEGAQTFLSAQMGPILGLLAAGALVFALAPLQRFADGLADRAMPGVQDTAEYRTVRKREVYRAAVESALVDGSLSEKDRGVLATLAQQLELGAKDAHDIEREARAARAGVAA